MQLEAGTTSVMRTIMETYRGEGVGGFFKGALSPLIGVTPYNTMVFTVTETVKRALTENRSNLNDQQKSFVAGSCAATAALIIYCPIELLKVRAQVNRQEFIKYREAIPTLIRNEGPLSLYKGMTALMVRDVPGWGVYFWSYEVLKDMFGV